MTREDVRRLVFLDYDKNRRPETAEYNIDYRLVIRIQVSNTKANAFDVEIRNYGEYDPFDNGYFDGYVERRETIPVAIEYLLDDYIDDGVDVRFVEYMKTKECWEGERK